MGNNTLLERLRIARVTEVIAVIGDDPGELMRALTSPPRSLKGDIEAYIHQLETRNKVLEGTLQSVIDHCRNTGRENPVVAERIVDRCEETASSALKQIAAAIPAAKDSGDVMGDHKDHMGAKVDFHCPYDEATLREAIKVPDSHLCPCCWTLFPAPPVHKGGN